MLQPWQVKQYHKMVEFVETIWQKNIPNELTVEPSTRQSAYGQRMTRKVLQEQL